MVQFQNGIVIAELILCRSPSTLHQEFPVPGKKRRTAMGAVSIVGIRRLRWIDGWHHHSMMPMHILVITALLFSSRRASVNAMRWSAANDRTSTRMPMLTSSE